MIFVTDDSCLFHFIGKWNKKGKYAGIQILTCDAKRILQMVVWSKNVFKGTVAVFMVRAISLIKDFCVVETQSL